MRPRPCSGAMQWLQTWTMKHAEVWWVEFDPAVGSEVRKTRPAVIVGNDAANRHLARVVAVPLPSNGAVTIRGRPRCRSMASPPRPWLIRSWQRAADNARLKSRLGGLSKLDMRALEDAILVHLGMPR